MPEQMSILAIKAAVLGGGDHAPLATVPRYTTWVDARWTTPTAARFAEAYRANSAFHSCVKRLALCFVEPPFRAMRRQRDGSEVADPASPLQALLNQPNPDQSQREWLRMSMVYQGWGGNCYLNLIPDK